MQASRTAIPVASLNEATQVLHPNPLRLGFLLENNSSLDVRYVFDARTEFPFDVAQAHLLRPTERYELKAGDWDSYTGALSMKLEDPTSGNAGYIIVTEFIKD